jgi:hypothetical protein
VRRAGVRLVVAPWGSSYLVVLAVANRPGRYVVPPLGNRLVWSVDTATGEAFMTNMDDNHVGAAPLRLW